MTLPERRASSGFTILELILVVVLLAVLPALLLPPLLDGRQAQNEAAAMDALRMLGTAARLAPPPAQPGPRLAGLCLLLMPSDFQPDSFGVVQRQGYRYREAPASAPAGCWAWPTLPGYSGRRVYWLDYGKGEVYAVAGRWSGTQDAPPDRPPAPDSLRPPS